MLSLDISGAFPNTSHERLCWMLERKGFPHGLNTLSRISYAKDGRDSPLAASKAHGSRWKPVFYKVQLYLQILFLLFTAELLESLQQPTDKTLGFGFVDDTNLIAWGSSAGCGPRQMRCMGQAVLGQIRAG